MLVQVVLVPLVSALAPGVRPRLVQIEPGLDITVHELAKPGPLVQSYIAGKTGVAHPIADPFGCVLWPGGHLAAKLLSRHRDRVRGQRVLCLGVGTGLEALTAAKLGAREVVACDSSPLVLSLLRDAAEASGTGAAICTQQLDLCGGEGLPDGAAFGVVVAADVFYNAGLAFGTGIKAADAFFGPERPPWLVCTDSQYFDDTWPAFLSALSSHPRAAPLPIEPRVAVLPQLTGSGILAEDDVTADHRLRYISWRLDGLGDGGGRFVREEDFYEPSTPVRSATKFQFEPRVRLAVPLAAMAMALLPARAPTLAADRPPPPLAADDPRGISSGVRGADGTLTFSFDKRKLGLVLGDDATGIIVRRVEGGSAAEAAGVLPLSKLVSINGNESVSVAAEAAALIEASPRPIRLGFDVSAYDGLTPDAVIEKAAAANGMQVARVGVQRLDGSGRPVGATAVADCSFASRESDVLEIEYEASVEGGGTFDSSASRSGRPFALMLGNSDSLPGLEVGLFEMCIGERRRIRVPPSLGFGARGSKTYGVKPGATLIFDATLVSINGQTGPKLRREDLPDEQRF